MAQGGVKIVEEADQLSTDGLPTDLDKDKKATFDSEVADLHKTFNNASDIMAMIKKLFYYTNTVQDEILECCDEKQEISAEFLNKFKYSSIRNTSDSGEINSGTERFI